MLNIPVLFLIFNRPEQTRQVFAAIRQAQPRQLFVAADGPRPDRPDEFEKCQAARQIVIEGVDWECEVHTLFRDQNLGCRQAVSSAIDWFFAQVEEGIILEDDCLPDQSFFGFCETLLERYRDTPQVMHISGDNFQYGCRRGDASYYFSVFNHNWGWATWRRAWGLYDVNMAGLDEFIGHGRIAHITADPSAQAYWLKMFEQAQQGKIDTWDYQWTFAIWFQEGLSAIPNVNLVKNIGFGADATHTNSPGGRLARLVTEPLFELKHPSQVKRNEEADQFTFEYHFTNRIDNTRAIAADVSHLLDSHREKKALELAQQGLYVHPNDRDLLFAQSLALSRLSRLEDAASNLQRLLAIYPDHQDARQLLATLTGRNGKTSDSIRLSRGAPGEVRSPITHSTNVVFDSQLTCASIIASYQRNFGIDVSRYFQGLEYLSIFRCLDTGLRFYYPFNCEGESELYEKLESYPWYYMDWKWEHQVANSLIQPSDRVLEVGCGRGAFLEKLQQQGIHCTGLELNASALRAAQAKGLSASSETIQEYARRQPHSFDVVCSFQVLEHVASVGEFVQACVAALKPGGKLILSVPNMDSLVVKFDEDAPLNKPPHHMSLWDQRALIGLTKAFELELDGIEVEPLQSYHVEWAQSVARAKFVRKHGALGEAMLRESGSVVAAASLAILEEIPGHTILAHYKKTGDGRREMTVKRKSLSIVHINTWDIIGGAATVARRLAEAQKMAGHQSHLLVGGKQHPNGSAVQFDAEPDSQVLAKSRIRGLLDYEFQGSHRLVGQPVIESADVLHLHNLHGYYFNPFSILLLSRSKPVVWTLHDMQAITGHCAHSYSCDHWKTGCEKCPDLSIYPALPVDSAAQLWQDKRWIFDHSHLQIVTPSEWLKRKVTQSILQDHPVEVIYNGVDTRLFKPYDKGELRRGFKLPEDALLVGSLAHEGVLNNPWKGGGYTIAAMEALRAQVPNSIFLNIGAGGESGHPAIINVPYIADQNTLSRLIASLDIFLFTSLAENCPLSILEAKACGVPVVAFATGGVPELVRDGQDGWVVGYRDQEAINQALISLSKDPACLKRFGWEARQDSVARFEHERIAAQYESLYKRWIEAWSREKEKSLPIRADRIPAVIRTGPFMSALNRLPGFGQDVPASDHSRPVKERNLGHLPGEDEALERQYKISAIVSTYASEEFMRECLQDLENQTIASQLEIVVVDANSPQSEGAIVEEFQKKYTNIRYIRTEERIGVYAAWNLAIRASSGEYIFTFSTNDRLSPNACEVLASALDEHPQVALVYGDSYLTKTPHETFERHTRSGEFRWPEYSFEKLLQYCLVGPHPMWRREIHAEIGYFDESYVAIGDQDFWLRLGERYSLLHIPIFTGLYWESPEALSRKGDLPNREIDKVHEKYQQRYLHRLKGLVESAAQQKGQDPESLFLREFGFLPETAAGLQALAELCRSSGMIAKAEAYQEKAEGMMVALRLRRADWLLQQGNQAEAKELLMQSLEVLPGNSRLLSALEQIEYGQQSVVDRTSAQVDIVIPIYRQPRLIQRCVNSILRTTLDAHLFLVDDASADIATHSLLDSYKGHPRITVVYNPQNLGFIGATRRGADLGQAPFILFLNSDVEALEPGWLDRMIPSEDDVAIVGVKLLYPPAMPGPLAGTIQHAGIARSDNVWPFHPFMGQPAHHPQVNIAREVNAVTGACFLIRRRVWDELGGWDGRFGRGVYEDVDLCWQARRRGYRVFYQPGATLLHWQSASQEIDGNHKLHLDAGENLERLRKKWSFLRSDEEIFIGKRDFQRYQKARAWMQKARKALERKNLPDVIAATKRAMKIAPELLEVMTGYAQVLSIQGDHAAAAECFEKALRSNPKDWVVWFRTVDEWQAAGLPERAAALLAQLKAQFPLDPKVLEREAALAAWMPRPVPPAPARLPAREDPRLPPGPAAVSARPEQVFSMLLEADDLTAALQEHRDQLDAGLLELVQANAAAARSDGNLELAAGLEDLAEVIGDFLALPNPQSQEDPAVDTLEMLLEADDLPAALQQHQDRLTPGLLALVQRNAQAAHSDGDNELAEGLDDLAEYIEQALKCGNPVPAAAD